MPESGGKGGPEVVRWAYKIDALVCLRLLRRSRLEFIAGITEPAEIDPIRHSLGKVGFALSRPTSQGLDRLVLACLAKDPGERLQSARELAERLRALENDAT